MFHRTETFQVMSLLAEALDILQGEKNMYMGYLLPVIATLERKLRRFDSDQLIHCDPLKNAILSGVSKR